MTDHPYGDRIFRDGAWQALVRRYSGGRRVCNCGNAYEAPDGGCAFGCGANKDAARGWIAEQALAELRGLGVEVGS